LLFLSHNDILLALNSALFHSYRQDSMKTYLYLSLSPEGLIASMLSPEEFGNYLAVGAKKRTRGQAMFFEVDPDFSSDYFGDKETLIREKCVPHADGVPKRSLHLSIYRVLEHVPVDALRNLYLVTDDGRVLSLEAASWQPRQSEHLHLYQQLGPVSPRIASTLDPVSFLKFVTDTSKPVSVPKLVFVELVLNDLAADPLHAILNDLPYPNVDHLRDCLLDLERKEDKKTKTIIRHFSGSLLYRTCKNGFFVGDQKQFRYYPLPSINELEENYYTWWRSAQVIGCQ